MLKFELSDGEPFAAARFEGLVSVQAWAAVLDDLGKEFGAHVTARRLVIDLQPLVGYLGVPERQAVGALMAKHLAGLEKVALVVQAHKITNVVRDEAQRNGLNLRLFRESSKAQGWVTA